MHISLALIPTEVQHIAGSIAHLGQEVKKALQSNTAINIEALVDKFVPQAAGLRTQLASLCNVAITTCQSIQHADWSGVTARLQRLVADSTQLLHGNQHNISIYIQWVETIIRDLLNN